MTTTVSAGSYDPQFSPVTPAEDARTILINKVSWGAILAGVVTALVAQLILNLIGIGIGASTLDPTTTDNPAASTFSIGAGIWWALSGIIAAFIGGYVSSRLSGRPKESTGGWHGLTSWAATTLLVFYLLSTAVGSLVGGAFSTVSSALGGLGKAAGSAVQTAAPAIANTTDPLAFLNRAVRTTGNDPAALRDDAVSAIRDLLTGDASKANDARERAAQALARSQNIPIEEARTPHRRLREAVPRYDRSDKAASCSGGRHSRQGGLSGRAPRQPCSAARSACILVRRTPRCRRPDRDGEPAEQARREPGELIRSLRPRPVGRT